MIEELIKQLPTASPFFVLIAGFVIGFSHAFEPDHVVAVATQNSKSSQKSSLSIFRRIGSGAVKNSILGALWGAGHTSALVLVSLLIFVFSINIPGEMFGNFEFGVGMMLVILGLFTYLNRRSVEKNTFILMPMMGQFIHTLMYMIGHTVTDTNRTLLVVFTD